MHYINAIGSQITGRKKPAGNRGFVMQLYILKVKQEDI